MRLRGKDVALLGIFSGAAIALSILETLLFGGLSIGLPGVKLGMANIAVLVALRKLGGKGAAAVALVKAFAAFFASGALTILWYSLAGTLLSFAGMLALNVYFGRTFSLAGISAAGGVLSNLGQLLVMLLLSRTVEFLYYLPLLAIAGVITGIVNGVLATLVLRRIDRAP